VVGLGVLAGCARSGSAPPPLSEAERQQLSQRVEAYFRRAANLPREFALKVTDLDLAAVPGTVRGAIEVAEGGDHQRYPFIASRDGRYFVRGEFTDLAVDPLVTIMNKIRLDGEPIRGAPDAPVTIVEYADFQCPFCARAYRMLEEQLLREYEGKVRLVFKHLPLSDIHPWARRAAVAAECARSQGEAAFWQMHDALFREQAKLTAENLRSRVLEVAKQAGLDVDAAARCFDGEATLPSIEADVREATSLGVRSTPTFFVDGRRLEGALPYEDFKTVVEQALREPLHRAAPAGEG